MGTFAGSTLDLRAQVLIISSFFPLPGNLNTPLLYQAFSALHLCWGPFNSVSGNTVLLLLLFAGGSGCAHSCPLLVYFIVLYSWGLHPQPLDFSSQIPVPVILCLKITEAMLCDSFCHFVELMGE